MAKVESCESRLSRSHEQSERREGRGVMKGYKLPPMKIEYKEDDILVGCKRCNHMWYERRLCGPWRINGPSYDYDYCDKCIKPNETNPPNKPSEEK